LDADLVRRACEGDRRAFQALVERHYDFIHATAWKWMRNRADAEDVAQDVCIKLASAIRSYRGDSQFRTWLYTLVLNAARDRMRRSERDRRTLDELSRSPPESDLDTSAEEIWAAVHDLSPKQRDAVMLVYAEGLDHSAAGRVLGCSDNTVAWHLHAARKRLKRLFGREVA
jgi:RNA polymerase sigma-70 factor (ECF subfamily)